MDGTVDDPAAVGTGEDAPDGVAPVSDDAGAGDAAADVAPVAPESPSCPYLHLQNDPNTSAAFAHEEHACFKAVPPSRVALRIQERFCLTTGYARCPVYREVVTRPPGPRWRLPRLDSRQVAGLVAFVVVLPAVLGAVFALIADGDGESRAVDSVGLSAAPALDADSADGGAAQDDDATLNASAEGSGDGGEAADPDAERPVSAGLADEPDPRPPLEQLLDWETVADHAVLSGDTLSEIAGQFETTVEAIVRFNGLRNEEIFEGQELRIPVGFDLDLTAVTEAELEELPEDAGPVETLRAWPRLVDYFVQSGDSLLLIAANFRTTAEAIALLNELGGNAIFAGQTLRVPVGYQLDLTGQSEIEVDDPLAVLEHWPQLVEYRVAEGDALSRVAAQHGTTSEAIARYNGFEGDTIILGALLIVPVNFQLPLPPLDPDDEGSPDG